MDWSSRSVAREWMDSPDVPAVELAQCLRDLARVNSVTLARPPTLAFLRRIVRRLEPGARLSVLDVGSGQGDMLRRIARWGIRRGLPLQLDGVDLSSASTDAARAATPSNLPIRFRTDDVFDEAPASVDVVISSLFTHHLRDVEIVRFLRWMERTARRGWFINDLHRHPVAFYGFAALSRAAGWHPMVQHDGPISVARSFRRRDWEGLLRQAGLAEFCRIAMPVPFRLCVSRVR